VLPNFWHQEDSHLHTRRREKLKCHLWYQLYFGFIIGKPNFFFFQPLCNFRFCWCYCVGLFIWTEELSLPVTIIDSSSSEFINWSQNCSLNIVTFISEWQSLESDLWHLYLSFLPSRNPVFAYSVCRIIILPSYPVGILNPSLSIESWQIKSSEWFCKTQLSCK
jgi:hypothetical protein